MFLFVTVLCVSAVDTIRVTRPLIAPDTPANRSFVDDILERSAVLASRRYADYFTVEYAAAGGVARGGMTAGRADYTLQIVASLDNEAAGIFEMQTGDEEQSMSFLGVFTEESIGFIANIYASLWNTFTDGFAARRVDPPQLLDVLPTDVLLTSVPGLAPAQISSSTALSAAVKGNGNLLLAFGGFVTELDRHMHIVRTIGREMMERGNYTFAGGVYLTPADTLYLRPTMGRQAQRLVDGSDIFQPVNLGMDAFGPFTVLNDGSIVAFDMTSQKTFRIDSEGRKPLDLKTSPASYIYYLGTGPEGNIWAWDMTERRFKIHAKDGVLIDAITPITSAADYLTPMNAIVLPDGTFILFVQGASGFELRKYARDGALLWTMSEIDLPLPEMLPNNVAMAFDPDRGYLYIVDFYGRRIFRLLDTDWTRVHRIEVSRDAEVLALNEALKLSPRDTEVLRAKAVFYTKGGSIELAIAAWKEVLAVDPYDADATARLSQLQTEVLKQQAASETERMLAMLDSLGPASAQMQYMSTLRIYEQILMLSPDDEEVRRAMENLMRTYQTRSVAPSGGQKPARIAEINIENLFPSLMLTYRTRPVGEVVLHNSTGSSINDVEISFFIRKYMDFPASGESIDSLADGEEATLPLFALLNEEVLRLQEDLPVQAAIEARYTADGEEIKISKTATITLYRNTALTWDESGKLASFIMPNEGVVSSFAHRVLSSVDFAYPGLPEKMVRAAKICDALGAYEIEYIEDPDSPFSSILGKAQVIDTVRFPRTTLYIRSGDCDDSTALLGSLLESAGISTAIMTSPGHVFLAFDTAEPPENAWLFDSEGFVSIRYGGSIWLPIETTILDTGFLSAWETASGLVINNPKEIEFLAVQEQRDRYPPLPLGESTLTVVEPQPVEISRLLDNSMTNTTTLLYNSGVDSLELALKSARGRRSLKLRNQLGVLHARFGETRKAVSVFEENMRADPDYTVSYLNLANLFVAERQSDEAIEVLKAGIKRDPDSANLNLLMARILHSKGNYEKAKQHYDTVRGRVPELAERFAYLAGEGDGTKRAGIEWEDFPLIWAEGEE